VRTHARTLSPFCSLFPPFLLLHLSLSHSFSPFTPPISSGQDSIALSDAAPEKMKMVSAAETNSIGSSEPPIEPIAPGDLTDDAGEFEPSEFDAESVGWQSITSGVYKHYYENGRRVCHVPMNCLSTLLFLPSSLLVLRFLHLSCGACHPFAVPKCRDWPRPLPPGSDLIRLSSFVRLTACHAVPYLPLWAVSHPQRRRGARSRGYEACHAHGTHRVRNGRVFAPISSLRARLD